MKNDRIVSGDAGLMTSIRQTGMGISNTAILPDESVFRLETRGRKPLAAEAIRGKIRNELTKIFLTMERNAMENLPARGVDVKEHVVAVVQKTAENL